MIKNKLSFLVCFCVLLVCIFPSNIYSKIGVGVGIGKIEVDESLKPGQIYNLPDLPVINTGDEPSGYQVSAEYRENVKELRPDKSWIKFYPTSLSLEPNSVQMVKVTIELPVNAKPGDYFVFLQAQPVKNNVIDGGVSTVNIAAATKLYFTIAPANIFQAAYYRIEYFWNKFYPWDLVVICLIVLMILICAFRKNFNIKISPKADVKEFKQIEEEEEEIIEEVIVPEKIRKVTRKKNNNPIVKKKGRSKKIKTEE
ncbi:MAG: hypothetical protein MCSN_0780 [Candidatus Microsyncoccus archaeolyticus]|nr:MAG: hypothetical protein MCSN_0780 [Candidatus Parcubacteria bacterium]